MKQSEALQIIDNLIIATQKARSNMGEVIGDDPLMKEVAGDLFPYTQGSNTILPVLLKISEAGKMAPLDLYNVLTLIDMKGMEVAGMYTIKFGEQLPEKQFAWMTEGWEPEDD